MEGRLDTGKGDALAFIATHKPYIGERFAIPYESIIDIEYGRNRCGGPVPVRTDAVSVIGGTGTSTGVYERADPG